MFASVQSDVGACIAFRGEIFGHAVKRSAAGTPTIALPLALSDLCRDAVRPDCLCQFDGIFSVACANANRTVLFTDPSNLVPLYWAWQAGGAAKTSFDPAELAQSATVSPTIARAGLHEFLRLLDIAAPSTFFEGVRAVEPGRPLILEPDGRSQPDLDAAAPPTATAATLGEAVEDLDALLRQVVAQRLDDCANPAAFLSGGIDSALVCAIAAQQVPQITAFTVGFDGAGFDESPVAARMADHLRIRHHVLRFSRKDYLAAFARLARGMDQPMADPATMATLLAFEHCRERVDVVLDGTGADEAVGAMPPRHSRLGVEFASRLPVGLRRAVVRAMGHLPVLVGYTPIFDFEHPAETLMRWKGFTRAEIEALCGEPVHLEDTTFYRTFARFPRQAHYERYSALLNAMPCDRLAQAMRLTGLRVRYPFCARDVDGFLRQLPTEWRHLPGQPKRILRELLARYIPVEIWDRPKQGFNFPLHDFLAGDDYALVRRHVLEGRWLDRNLLRPDVVRRYAQQYIAGNRTLMFRVWALAVLGAWLDAHEDVDMPPARA